MPSDRLWLRSELMGTQVITRDTGRRLGVVGEVIVDIDGREVVALGLRDNPLTRFLPGLPRWMRLERIRQVGDVILVDSIDSLSETFSPERYSRVINCQVITESGSVLGRVLGFSFDIETGELSTLVMGALGVPLLGEGVLSTWEIPVDEIVSSGPDRIIVYEGAEDKLKQLNSGVLEKLGVGGPSWEEQERERYRVNVVPVENQLSSGQPAAEQQKQLQASESASFAPEEELEYVEVEDRRSEQQSQRRYMDDLPERDAYSRRDSYDSQDDDRRQAYSDQERYGRDRYRDTPNAAPDDNADTYGDERFERERFARDRNEPPERYAADPQPWDDAVAMNPDPEVGMEVDRFEARPRPAARRAVQPPEDPLDVEPLEADEAYASRSDREPLSNRNDLDDPW